MIGKNDANKTTIRKYYNILENGCIMGAAAQNAKGLEITFLGA